MTDGALQAPCGGVSTDGKSKTSNLDEAWLVWSANSDSPASSLDRYPPKFRYANWYLALFIYSELQIQCKTARNAGRSASALINNRNRI